MYCLAYMDTFHRMDTITSGKKNKTKKPDNSQIKVKYSKARHSENIKRGTRGKRDSTVSYLGSQECCSISFTIKLSKDKETEKRTSHPLRLSIQTYMLLY